MHLEKLVEKSQESTLFTEPVLGKDLRRFLDNESAYIHKLAERYIKGNVKHIYWVGSGN